MEMSSLLLSSPWLSLSSVAVRNGPSTPLQLHHLHGSCSGGCADFEEDHMDILPVAHNNNCWIEARCPNQPPDHVAHPAVPELTIGNMFSFKYTQNLLTVQLAVCEQCGWDPPHPISASEHRGVTHLGFPCHQQREATQPEGDSSHSCRLGRVSWLLGAGITPQVIMEV